MRPDRWNPTPDVAPLAGPPPGIVLWWCDLEYRARDATRLMSLLSDAERERAARFGSDMLRHRWIAGRATLRELLGIAIDCAPAEVPLRRGRRGRPEVAIDDGPDFNVSHTQGAALIAIGVSLARNVRIGVDIERDDRDVDADRLARKFLTARERAAHNGLDADARRRSFLRTWTCKEAMSKATGDGLVAPFRALDVELDDPPRLVSGPSPYEWERWQLVTPRAPQGHFATIALWSQRG